MARKQTGFTLLELMVTMAVAAALLGIAIPAFSVWLPNYRLKNAALDVFSNFQQAKMMAVRANDPHSLVFDPGNNRYEIQDSGGAVVKSVSLDRYGNPGEVTLGGGDATKNATTSGGALPGDGVSYGSETVTFNARGMGNAGYVYLQNNKGTAYALGTESSGLIKMRKWNGSDWE
jgi:prepilin-type N-terminal cleavage/methylation domain-containing protein